MPEFKVPKKIKKTKKPLLSKTTAYTIVFCISMLLAGVVALKLYLISLPPISNLNQFKPNVVTQFYSSDGEIIKTFTAYTFSKASLKDIPANMQNAIIATEDKNFYRHSGYDLFGLARSMVANILAGRVVQGASTISQQLARILFLSNEKTFNRKLKEFVIAARIEKTISKDKILEMYLNNVYLGSGAYGVDGAAEIYFNKPLKNLTLAECALIAGLPQAPSIYSPFNDIKKAEKRRNQVLNRMYKERYITKNDYHAAKKEKITLNPLPQIYTTNKAPYFCDYIMKELEALGFDEVEISQGGYKVITTLDYQAQQQANAAVVNILNSWGMRGDKQQSAVFSYSPIDGRIFAYVGGKDYSKTQYDRVMLAVRPPGSAFKPFVYATALEKGVQPNDMIEDTPFRIGDWAPRNYGNKYRGKIPMYTALMVSSNVCAARLIKFVGIRPVIQLARVLGIETPIEYDYTIGLGSNGVKLYEMTRAYGAFANGGFRVEPYGIERIETSRGQVIYQAPKTKISKVLDLTTASTMTAMLKTVLISGTGTAANIGKPSAGKTGTTDDYKDAWFIGYTPEVVTGVWVGNDDNSKMGNLTGGTVPALIWKSVMLAATAPFGKSEFDYPTVELKAFSLKGKTPLLIKEDERIFAEDEKNDENQENKSDDGILAPDFSAAIKPTANVPRTLNNQQKQTAAPASKPAVPPPPVAKPITNANFAPIPMSE